MYLRQETITAKQLPVTPFIGVLDAVSAETYLAQLNELFISKAVLHSFEIQGNILTSTSVWNSKELYQESVDNLNTSLAGFLTNTPDDYYSNTDMFDRVVEETIS